ncbi:MAG: hypothetical protein GY799_06875 [Desulfobulbaceae bacterium]|nr:hypothetical protein [Desulfobulbaceae bacterium]
MKTAGTPKKQHISFSEETFVSFIEAFYRIFKVGIYYPDGHVVLDQSATACIQQLREVSPSSKCVKIEVERNGLLIQKMKLPETSRSVKELHLLLAKLGIRTIEIEKSLQLKELVYFVKNVLIWRSQMETTRSLISFNIVDLPPGIRLEQLEFLVDERSILQEASNNDHRQSLNDICIALEKQGLTKQQVQQCKGFLEKISESTDATTDSFKGFPNATWADVQTLLYAIITGTNSGDEQRTNAVASSDIDVISSIFDSLELSHSDKKSKETIRFLMSHLSGRNTGPSKTVKESVRPKIKLRQLLYNDQVVSVSALKTFIFENSIPLRILEQINSVDSSEEMSIILQLISSELDKQLRENLEQKLKTILRSKLTEREKNVLVEGVKNLADSGKFESCRDLLTLVLHALRDIESHGSLDFVVELWSKMPQTMYLLIWPFVVNEFLVVGQEENKESFYEAARVASQMHIDGMKNLSSQLEELDAFQKKLVGPSVFCPKYLFSYRLFAFLLGTSLGEIIAEKIVSGLLVEPKDKMIAAVGPLLEITNVSHLTFVQSYLIQAHLEELPLTLKMAAGQIILEFLQNISEEEKHLPWLPKTIAAMAEFYLKDMESMLYKIVKEKKMCILPVWPKNCREAANDVLKSIKRPSLAELL